MSPPPLELALDYSLPASSRVLIQADLLTQRPFPAAAILANRQLFVITDSNVQAAQGNAFLSELHRVAAASTVHSIPPGEPSKSPEHLHACWQAMAAATMTRDAVVVAWGGGVVGDLAGLAAATFGRGLTWIQIPTTLMAQVDSSLGGKVGINLPAGKNLVGTVWQPAQVWIDPRALLTLPEREYRSGLAEVAKYAVILGEPFATRLRQQASALLARDLPTLEAMIATCCACKLRLVSADPLDQCGQRVLLNYGHTFGHALEQVSGYGRWTHGEAVAIGMGLAAKLALHLGRVERQFLSEQRALLDRFELPTDVPVVDTPELLETMARDKKALHRRLRFVLPSGWGQLALCEVTAADVAAVLNSGD